MTHLPELLTEDQWKPERVAFRHKCLDACLRENLTNETVSTPARLSKAIFEIAEECFLMGEAFGGKVFTDEEVEQINMKAEEKAKELESRRNQ